MNEALSAPTPCSGFTALWEGLCAEDLLKTPCPATDLDVAGLPSGSQGVYDKDSTTQHIENATWEAMPRFHEYDATPSPSMGFAAHSPQQRETYKTPRRAMEGIIGNNSATVLPWRTRLTRVADMYDELKLPSAPGRSMFREMPRISAADAACYWKLYFTHFHPV